MHYEIEQKFRCDDLNGVRQQLLALGATPGEVVDQSDCYYKHPVRDFAKTDEAFRIRRVGERNDMTYKGPKIDATTKSRREEEVRLADGAAAFATAGELVRCLGFAPVATVTKRRETFRLQCEQAAVEAALDVVERVGTYVELEIAVEAVDHGSASVAAAKATLAELAARLGLGEPERRSYLELLLSVAEAR